MGRPAIDPLARARQILSASPQEPLRRVISRSIAVGSGKGGVGKTITACNLAIFYARKNLRVGLVDLDPLSDVASLLDLYESEQALASAPRPAAGNGTSDGHAAGPGGALRGQIMPVFKGLDILFPYQKLDEKDARRVMEMIYRDHVAEIDSRYDVLLFDMPAGLSLEDNLVYIPFMKRLLLVTNPEPTAHASAGAYAKEVQRLFPGTMIRVWHNRYSREIREGFHPSDVAGNYNRFVDVEDRLTPQETRLLQDFAFVPEDPALDLLKGEPDPALHVLRSMKEGVVYAHGRLLEQATRKLGLPPRIQRIVTSYVHRNPEIRDVGAYLRRMEEYFTATFVPTPPKADSAPPKADSAPPKADSAPPKVAWTLTPPPVSLFSERQSAALRGYLERVKRSGLRREMIRMEALLEDQVERKAASRRPFGGRLAAGEDIALDRELARFLVILNRAARGSHLMRNQGVLLLFHFSLHKLFQSRTLLTVLRSLVPRRKTSRGKAVRDRFRQIQTLVERDPAYRARYLKAVKTIHGLVTRQVTAVARALDLGTLVILDKEARLDDRPYLKLLAAFLHETLYSGLSVIVGFDYRSAAAAFQDGAERLLVSVRETA